MEPIKEYLQSTEIQSLSHTTRENYKHALMWFQKFHKMQGRLSVI
jgi:hypothetical protein